MFFLTCFKWDSFQWLLFVHVFEDYTGEEMVEWKASNQKFFLSQLRIYVKAVLLLIKEGLVNGIAHIMCVALSRMSVCLQT